MFNLYRIGRVMLSAVVAVTLSTSASLAASVDNTTDSDTAVATATVIKPITISRVNDLYFGTIAPTGTSGTVVVSPDGTTRTADNVGLLPSNTGGLGRAFGAASFSVTGQEGQLFNATFPTSVAIKSADEDEMSVDLFSSEPTNPVSLPVATYYLHVGARLNVGASQPAGYYNGQFNVTVTYQ